MGQGDLYCDGMKMAKNLYSQYFRPNGHLQYHLPPKWTETRLEGRMSIRKWTAIPQVWTDVTMIISRINQPTRKINIDVHCSNFIFYFVSVVANARGLDKVLLKHKLYMPFRKSQCHAIDED